MGIQEFFMQLLSGISMGMGLFVVASGLVLVFSVLKILNFAHGVLYMLGAYTFYSIIHIIAGLPGRFWISIISAPVIVAIAGGLIELVAIRRLYGQHLLYQLLLCFGLIYIIEDVVKLIWGTQYYDIYPPAYLSGAVNIFAQTFPRYNLVVTFAGLIVFVCIYIFLNKTKWGALIRAISTEPEMARTLGHNVTRVFTFVFMGGCFLAGLGGSLVAPMGTIMLGMHHNMIVFCFVIIVIGGFGSLEGALVGALILGLVQSFGIVIVPEMAVGLPYIFLTIFLLVRPWGLFGKEIIE